MLFDQSSNQYKWDKQDLILSNDIIPRPTHPWDKNEVVITTCW